MSEVKKAKKTRKPIRENISEHIRASQEPISNKTRQRKDLNTNSDTISDINYGEIVGDISTTICNEEIVGELKPSIPTQKEQYTESSVNRLRGISDSLKGLCSAIKWFQTWEPIEEKIVQREGKDISQPKLFDDIFAENQWNKYSSKIQKIRYHIEMERAERERENHC